MLIRKTIVRQACTENAYLCRLGQIVTLMSRSAQHRGNTVSQLLAIAKPAIDLERVQLYLDGHGQVVGYVIWVHVSEEVHERFMQTGNFALHLSEWNEGPYLWIYDFIALESSLRPILADLRDGVFATESCVNYARPNGQSLAIRSIARNPDSWLFS
jgi:hemolysin-activating ACP:hemolysin acyltransferase